MEKEHIGILLGIIGFCMAGGIGFVLAYVKTHPRHLEPDIPLKPAEAAVQPVEEEIVDL